MKFLGVKGAVAGQIEVDGHVRPGNGSAELRAVWDAGRRLYSAEEEGAMYVMTDFGNRLPLKTMANG